MLQRLTLNGVNLDVDPIELPPEIWSVANNMIPQVGKMRRARGYKEIFKTPLFPAYYLQYTPQLGVPYWAYCGINQIGTVNSSGVHADITPASLTVDTDPNSWTGGNLNGLCVLNSIENEPYYWFAGEVAALPLPGQRSATTRYRVMRPFKYHLFGLGVLDSSGPDYADQLHWSDAADPGQIPATWVPAADNEAGDNTLSDEDGAIIDGLALRDSFYIYKQDSVYEASFSGGSEIFRFRKVFGSTGVLALNCVVRVKGTHIVLGNGDIYRHDGQNMASIVDGTVRDTFFSAIDDENYENSFALYNEPAEEVWFCVPTTGNTTPNVALVWSVVTGQFGYRSLPFADYAATGIIGEDGGTGTVIPEPWDDDSQAWDEDTTRWLNNSLSVTEDTVLITNAEAQKFYRGDSGTTADGEVYDSYVSRWGLDLEDPEREKGIRRIWPRINAPSTTVFTLELYNQRSPYGDQEKVFTRTFTQQPEGVAVNCNARYLGITIRTSESVDWDIGGFDVEFIPQGHF